MNVVFVAVILTKPRLEVAAHQVKKVFRETNDEARRAPRLHRINVYADWCGICCLNDEAQNVLNQVYSANILDRSLGG